MSYLRPTGLPSTLAVNFKGENNVSFFPETARPERLRFTDTAGQGGVQKGVRIRMRERAMSKVDSCV